MRRVGFGVIGCGLMGREFAGASARWLHLKDALPRPEIVAVCDVNASARGWFERSVPGVAQSVSDYRALLENPEVEAVYCALPHHLHEQVYVDCIRAGKHLLGEKPFGVDMLANAAILRAAAERPELLIRCASEFPFFPGARKLYGFVRGGGCGRILGARAVFAHASDLNEQKPINWKRQQAFCGAYGCMGDLGLHAEHIPFRLGWKPKQVYAMLSDVVRERPDGRGGMAACDTCDNAALLCRSHDAEGVEFPLSIELLRLSPGSTNSWSLEVSGMRGAARFTTEDANAFHYMNIENGAQAWRRESVGHCPQFATETGGIFEFGFSDAILQMFAAFMAELSGQSVEFGCATPEEARLSHALHTAALRSDAEKRAIDITEV